MKHILVYTIILFSLLAIHVVSAQTCGNKVCESGEDQRSCCKDCGCPFGFICYENVCRKTKDYVINATEDSWVTSRNGTGGAPCRECNYGSSGAINYEATCNEFWTWVKFDNSMIPDYPLNSSFLCFECYYKARRFTNSLKIYNATNNWAEMNITGANMPPLGFWWNISISISAFDYCPKTYCVNVTLPVSNARGSNMTLVLHSTDSCSATDPCWFKSTEYDGGDPKITNNLIEPAYCEDGFCQPNETQFDCPKDCQGYCNDTLCNYYWNESALNCPKDCQGSCGDTVCNPYWNENQKNCCQDCGCPQGLECINNKCAITGTFAMMLPFFIMFTILAFIYFVAYRLLGIEFPSYRKEFSIEAGVNLTFTVVGVIITILVTITMLGMLFTAF